MQNTPRIYIDKEIILNDKIAIDKTISHYLRHVMRTNKCLVFNNGIEYNAILSDDDKYITTISQTEHIDPCNDIELYFAPIKKTDELVNMATQMGISVLQPVITERTVAHHINWERIKKIIIEASEQSNRNSIPKLRDPIKFSDVDLNTIIIADERAGHDMEISKTPLLYNKVFIGPEGGFSQHEFDLIDSSSAQHLSLGKTILRAEVAGVVAIAKVINK